MRRAVWWSGTVVLLAFVLTLAVVGQPRGQAPVPAPEAASAVPADRQRTLRLKQEGQVRTVSMESYLIGVLCCEMPLDFEPAALQAQAVASRTFTLYQSQGGKHPDCDVCADSGCCQAWKSEEQLAALFGADWPQRRERAAAAVAATDGQVLTQDGALINAVFFSCSGGLTEPAAAVWGAEVSYLQSVQSPGEEIASVYTDQTVVDLDTFRQTLVREEPAVDLSGNPAAWFGTQTRTPGDGVASLEIGGVSFTGTRLRSLFGLNSTRFTVAVSDGGIVFETRGKGHRVGMSQYGAQAMALAGSDHRQILLHYYTGVQLTEQMDP